MNTKDLWNLTLVGPTRDNPVVDPLALLQPKLFMKKILLKTSKTNYLNDKMTQQDIITSLAEIFRNLADFLQFLAEIVIWMTERFHDATFFGDFDDVQGYMPKKNFAKKSRCSFSAALFLSIFTKTFWVGHE